jgi:hypothetical protein
MDQSNMKIYLSQESAVWEIKKTEESHKSYIMLESMLAIFSQVLGNSL